MNLALVFRISGVILILNGISMFFMPVMAVGMYGWEESGPLIVVIRALGVSFLGTGILALMLPGLDREQTCFRWHAVGGNQSRLGCPHWI